MIKLIAAACLAAAACIAAAGCRASHSTEFEDLTGRLAVLERSVEEIQSGLVFSLKVMDELRYEPVVTVDLIGTE